MSAMSELLIEVESAMTTPQAVTKTVPAASGRTLLKRLGYAGFLFFLIKGLLWLAAPAVFYFFSR